MTNANGGDEHKREAVDSALADSDKTQWPPPTDPAEVADQFLEKYRHGDKLTLRHWRGNWVKWDAGVWTVTEDAVIRAELWTALKAGYYLSAKSSAGVLPWSPTRNKIADVEHAMQAATLLSETAEPGDWIGDPKKGPAPGEVFISVKNGILRIPGQKQAEHTPDLFNLVQVPFKYDDAAADPRRWLKFLGELWPGDTESIQALQEWFGYVVSGRTDLHKMVLLVGPTRAGKSAIARVLGGLVGPANVAAPSLATLGANFGLQPVIGKPLAIIPDARLGRGANQIVERLLALSGEDLVTVDRKYKEPWTGRITARFMIITNEIPRLGDASAAIAKRFVLLVIEPSFLGKEDPGLTDKLLIELGGIFKWALDGLDRLDRSGKFVEPAASKDATRTMEDLTSPVAAFIRDRCVLGPDYKIPVIDLFKVWKDWCETTETRPGTAIVFGRNLSAAHPAIHRVRRRAGGKRLYEYEGIAARPADETRRGVQLPEEAAGDDPVEVVTELFSGAEVAAPDSSRI